MKSILALILTCYILTGCTSHINTNETSVHKKTITIDGTLYTLVRNASTNSNGYIDVELWENSARTNRYFMLSIDKKYMIAIPK